jgi:hypothetical protein
MKRSNPTVWTIIGTIVGIFLTPSGWLLLLAAFIGPQLANLGSDSGTATDTTLPPELGGGTIGEDAPTGNGSAPGWFLALVLVALVITVLSSVFFGWVGRRLAEARNQRVEVIAPSVE